MKIAISYPPIQNALGQTAMVSQNRNVQFFKKPTFLLPVVYAQAATWLNDLGHDVYWDDGNAQKKSFDRWRRELIDFDPDLVVLESTTPVMKFYWRLIDDLKLALPNSIIILSGFHSLRKPDESIQACNVDIVMATSNIDFCLVKLVDQIGPQKPNWRLTLDVPGLVIRLPGGGSRQTGAFRQIENLNSAPLVNRDLIEWKNYAYENGNFLRTPGTYATSVIRDCIFGKCTFCRYNGPELSFSMMDVKKSVYEYQVLIEKYGVREIFDDSGVWYRGADAKAFAAEIIGRGLHKKGCYFGFNTRFEYLDQETIRLLGRANFRFVLLGYEAADDETLQRLNKGYQLEHVENCLRWMRDAGLHPHLTIMVGYYWQTQEQLAKTVSEVKRLMFAGLARTLQVTICTPLDYTPYHRECIERKVLLTEDYDEHDMSHLIVRTPEPHEIYYQAIRELYSIAFHPKFLVRQLLFLRNFRVRDFEFLFTYGLRAIRRVRQHVFNLTQGDHR